MGQLRGSHFVNSRKIEIDKLSIDLGGTMRSQRDIKAARIRRKGTRGRLTAGTALLGAACMALAACGGSSTASGSASSSDPKSQTSTIKIAALAFPEGQLVANVYALALQDAGFKTDLVQTQGRETAEPALQNGNVDLDVEYSSSMLEYYKQGASTANTDKNMVTLRSLASPKKVTVLNPSPATDNYAFGVATKFANTHNLKSLTDLASYSKSNPIVVAGIQECQTRSYCLAGLKSAYGLKVKNFKVTVLASQDSVDKLLNNTYQLVQFDSSDGVLAANPVTILTDPKGLNHPDHIVPAVYTPAASPALKNALNKIQARLTQDLLNSANKQIQVDRAPVAAVAKDLYQKLKA